MQKCPNCGRPTARTEDWACQWCGYPLFSRSYKKIPKTFRELREERQAGSVPPMKAGAREPERAVVPPPPEPRPEPKAVEAAKPPPAAEITREPVKEVRAEPVKEVEREPVAETEPAAEIETGVEPGAASEVLAGKESMAVEAPGAEVKLAPAAEAEARAATKPEARRKKQKTPQAEAEVETETEPVTEPVAEVEPETKGTPDIEPEAKVESDVEAEAGPETEEEIENEAVAEEGPVEEAKPEPEPDYGTVMESGAIKISVDGVISAFQANRAEAHQRFSDKVLCVTGVVEKVMVRDALDIFYILLDGKGSNLWHVRCIFDREYGSRLQRLGSGQTVTVQGNYAGYERNILLKDCALVG